MEKNETNKKRAYRRPRIVTKDTLEVVAGTCAKSDVGGCGKSGPVSS